MCVRRTHAQTFMRLSCQLSLGVGCNFMASINEHFESTMASIAMRRECAHVHEMQRAMHVHQDICDNAAHRMRCSISTAWSRCAPWRMIHCLSSSQMGRKHAQHVSCILRRVTTCIAHEMCAAAPQQRMRRTSVLADMSMSSRHMLHEGRSGDAGAGAGADGVACTACAAGVACTIGATCAAAGTTSSWRLACSWRPPIGFGSCRCPRPRTSRKGNYG